MSYTPPAGDAVNFSWVGESAYTPPAGDAINFSWEPDDTIPAGILGLTALVPQTQGAADTASPPTGTMGLTALLPGLAADQPMPVGAMGLTGLLPTPTAAQDMPAGSLGLTGLLPSIPVLQDMPAGSLGLTALAIPTPTVQVTGAAVRIYRLKLIIGGETTYAVPVNWQARYAIDRSNYLSVTLHAPEQSLIDLLNGAVGSSPAETVTLVIQGGYRWPDGSAYYRDMITSEMQDVTTSTGPRSSSTLLSGYLAADAGVVKTVTLPSAITIRSGTVATTWVGPIDIDLAPGDQVTVPDTGATFVVGNITYRVDARNATMDVSELTDADVLATLPW